MNISCPRIPTNDENAHFQNNNKNYEHPAGDPGQLISLILFLFIWVTDSFIFHKTTFLAACVHLFVRVLVMVVLISTSLILVKSGHRVINHGKPPNRLMTDGAFRYIRHPLYLAAILFYSGLTVATFSLASLGFLVIIVLFYDFIATYEEKLLKDKFGQQYENYRQKTGKWIPKIG